MEKKKKKQITCVQDILSNVNYIGILKIPQNRRTRCFYWLREVTSNAFQKTMKKILSMEGDSWVRLLNKLANSKGVSRVCGASHVRGAVWRVRTISAFCQKDSL